MAILIVRTLRRRPIDPEVAAQLVPDVRHRPNMLADMEYHYQDEGFRVNFTDVPVKYNPETGRELVYARISRLLHAKLAELVAEARRELAQQPPSRNVPITYIAPALDYANIA